LPLYLFLTPHFPSHFSSLEVFSFFVVLLVCFFDLQLHSLDHHQLIFSTASSASPPFHRHSPSWSETHAPPWTVHLGFFNPNLLSTLNYHPQCASLSPSLASPLHPSLLFSRAWVSHASQPFSFTTEAVDY